MIKKFKKNKEVSRKIIKYSESPHFININLKGNIEIEKEYYSDAMHGYRFWIIINSKRIGEPGSLDEIETIQYWLKKVYNQKLKGQL